MVNVAQKRLGLALCFGNTVSDAACAEASRLCSEVRGLLAGLGTWRRREPGATIDAEERDKGKARQEHTTYHDIFCLPTQIAILSLVWWPMIWVKKKIKAWVPSCRLSGGSKLDEKRSKQKKRKKRTQQGKRDRRRRSKTRIRAPDAEQQASRLEGGDHLREFRQR